MFTESTKPWLDNYEEGVSSEIDVPDYPLQHLLENSASKHPNRPALVFQGNTITYRELNDLTDRVAAALSAAGFTKGDRAVVYMINIPQFVISYFGILKAGGIVIATNPLYSERELEHQLIDCGAETVFVLSRYYNQLKSVQANGNTRIKRIIVTNVKEYLPAHLNLLYTLFKEKKGGDRVSIQPGDMAFKDFLATGSQAPVPQVDVTGRDVALLQYTGGTTGLSKGAIGLHRNLVSNTLAAREWLTDSKEAGEVVLTALPLFHSYGMIAAMNFGLLMAATLILIPDPRQTEDVLKSINKYQPTFFPGVPTMYVAINKNDEVAAGKYDIQSIRVCLSASAPLLQETKLRFEELTGGKLVEAYGLTEAHVATHANPIYGENRPSSIGLPLPGIDSRIVDAENGEKELPVGEIGELIVKGPSIMQGYWNMPTETKNTLRDGWLYTGDIARMDEQGYFYIEDRKKDMIIAGGFNIYPREVEEVLATHPAVLEAAVAGIPDAKRGETVKAWIVKQPGDPTTKEEVIEWSKNHLAKYKYPRIIEFRDELPKSTVGKILKRELIKEDEAT